MARLERLLRTVVADPDRTLGAIDLLTTDEHERLAAEWVDTACPPETSRSCSRQGRPGPDGVALR